MGNKIEVKLTKEEKRLIAALEAYAASRRRRTRYVVRQRGLIERIGDALYEEIPEAVENFSDKLFGLK